MAIPTGVAVGTASGGTSGITLNWPTHVADDYGILFTECVAPETVPAPTGWTEFPDSGVASAGGTPSGTKLQAFYKRATSSSEAAVTVGDPGDHVLGCIATFRGVDGTTPYNDTSNATGTGSTVTLPGGTTTVNDCLVLLIASDSQDSSAGRFSSWASPDLANVLGDHFDVGTTAGNGGGIGLGTGEKATAGSFGDGSVSHGSFNWSALTIALRPPQGGSTQTLTGSTPIASSAAVKTTGSVASVVTLTGSSTIASSAVVKTTGSVTPGTRTITGSSAIASSAAVIAGGALSQGIVQTLVGSTTLASSAAVKTTGSVTAGAATLTGTTKIPSSAAVFSGGIVLRAAAQTITGSVTIPSSATVYTGGFLAEGPDNLVSPHSADTRTATPATGDLVAVGAASRDSLALTPHPHTPV